MDEAKLSDLSYLDDYINAEKNIASQTAEDEDFSDMKNYVLLVFGIAAIQNPIQMALTFQRVVYRNYEQEEIKKEGKRRYSRSVEYDPNYVAPTDYMGYLNDNEYDRQRFMVKLEKGDKTLSVLKSITNTLGIVGLWRGKIL
ncbi:hypothetical protein O9G_003663 [Rozella allomycis CSF55]|uniref:Uncharacterized protein n=1 Tax=Rozella allomycis (strain CSF55) TaxID=988480 RepID=A0A075B0T2_ROZAC|nr:hypothetical protein O9G_003663 [Rozella allomycis CSF55]|eukprot:EPZ36091.1 hypothetical protein O9G_003663 [Rozella allomycis CSF55]